MNYSRLGQAIALALLASTGIALAQSTLGVVVGTVKDGSGAVLTAASIRLTNSGENTTRDGKATADGTFEFQNVKPGAYSVKVSAPGFRAFVASDIRVAARQTVRVDADMQLGDVTQVVEVSSSAGVIATDSPIISSTLSAENVLNLPGNVRGVSTSPYALIATLPGVQADNGGGYSIQGGLPAQSESSVDGISITAATGNSPQRSLFPSVESIAEIRVQGVGNNAEFGQSGDVTAISKGGSNQLHGAGFWYHQNRALDARSFGQAALPSKISNVFGFTIGGPLVLPKLYNGKNRTFFYFTYEALRLPRQLTIQNTVPTAAMKAGNFNGEPGVIVRDPLTGQPFPNNTIPTNRINPIARAILPFYPDPNQGNTSRVANANYINNLDGTTRSNQFDVRIDHQFSSKHMIFGRLSQKQNPSQSTNSLLLPNDTTFNDHRQAVVSYTWTISPTLLNEFRGGISFSKSGSEFLFDGRSFSNSLNLQDIQKDIFFNALPAFAIQNLTGFSKGRPGRGASWNTQYIDNLTWSKGKHTVKFGVAIRQLRAESNLGFTTGDNYGNYSFSGNFSNAPFGDFLLGAPIQTSVSVVQSDNDGRGTHYQAYVQDTFRATSRLTLDLGLRYEFQPGYSDAGFNIANFDRTVPVTGRVITMSDPQAIKLVAPATLLSVNACPAAAIGGVPCTPFVTAKEAGLPEALRKNYATQFLPRLGFAYRLGDKTTVRGSFGIYNMALLGSVFFSLTGTVQSDVRQFNNAGSDGRPLFYLPQTRPSGVAGVRGGSLGTFEFRTANQIDFHPPYMMQWGLSVDRQVTNSMGLRVSYIANKSTNLPWAPDLNQAQPSTNFFTQRPLTDRPFPNWGLIYSRDAGANSIYQAFQTELSRRFSKGLTFNAAYTLAKHLGDNAGPANTSFAGETGGGRVTNSQNRRGDRGDVYATRRHRSINTLVYELPFGKGRQFMASANRAVDAILGGWQISSILSLQSGPFLTPIFNGGDPSGTNAPARGTQRPDRLGDGSVASPDRSVWLDRNAFVCPGRTVGATQFNCAVGAVPNRDPNPIGRFGNSGVGIITGPGTFGWNMGTAKTFSLIERVSLRMEASFTNVPNAVNLGDPDTNITNNNFGRITGTRGVDFGGGRTGQVGMRLQF